MKKKREEKKNTLFGSRIFFHPIYLNPGKLANCQVFFYCDMGKIKQMK